MSSERLPVMSSSKGKRTVKPPLSSRVLHQKRTQNPSTSSSSSSHPHPRPSSILLSDTTITPWGGLAFSESSLTSIPPPPLARPHPPPAPSPPPLPSPQATPSPPYRPRQNEDEDTSSSSFNSEAPSSPGGGEGVLRPRQRVSPQRRVPHPPRLPPLRPITNLSFSRSFTFSFFELPLHHSPRCRSDRIRNLLLLLRQIHY